MTSSYEDIFSKLFGKIDDVKIASLDDNERNEIMVEWLKNVLSDVRVRSLFKSIDIDDSVQLITYELKSPLDDMSDKRYVDELLTLGMQIAWFEPKVNSVIYTAPMIGTKEEKKILDHYSDNIQRLSSMKTELKKMIRDRGFLYNSYIGDYQ